MVNMVAKPKRKSSNLQSLKSLLGKFDDHKDKYISREYQSYGVKLAEELQDKKHVSLYIKLARDEKRNILERARSFIKDAHARSNPKLFMWKISQLKAEAKELKNEKTKERKNTKIEKQKNR